MANSISNHPPFLEFSISSAESALAEPIFADSPYCHCFLFLLTHFYSYLDHYGVVQQCSPQGFLLEPSELGLKPASLIRT